MRIRLLLLITFLFFQHFGYALDVSVTHMQCYSEESGEYLELYVRINGNTVAFDSLEGQIKASILGLILIKEDNEIITADKFSIESPLVNSPMDFWSKRIYKLPPGDYKLEYTFSDLADETNTINQQRSIPIRHKVENTTSCSDILLMATVAGEDSDLPFGKYGFSFEPLAFDMLDPSLDKLLFFWEMYDLDQLSGRHFMSMTIYPGFTGTLENKVLQKHKKIDLDDKVIIVEEFPILDLVSGEYHLTLELFNEEKKQVLFSEKNFTLIQPTSDERQTMIFDKEFENSFVQVLTLDELNYSLRALAPQLSSNLVESLNTTLKSGNLKTRKYFLYSYWANVFPDRPGHAYESYMKVARAVDNKFSSHFGHGFETDRGHLFLKYGTPNDIIEVIDEVNTPPYEIWVYYDFPYTQQSNVKFLFYNPSLSGDDFILLHSNCSAEIQNKQWQQVLYSDAYNERQGNTIDGVNMQDNFNRKALRYFNDN